MATERQKRALPTHREARRASLRLVGLAAAVLAVQATLVAPVGAAAPQWSISPSTNPGEPTGQLDAVSCPASNFCMAVGQYYNRHGTSVALAEDWNGAAWTLLSAKNQAGAAGS